MLTTNDNKCRSEGFKSVNNTLKEMMGPVLDKEEDFKLKFLLGLGLSNEKGQFISKSKETLQEEMTTLDMNSNNSKESHSSKFTQETQDQLQDSKKSRTKVGSAFHPVRHLPSQSDLEASSLSDDGRMSQLSPCPKISNMSQFFPEIHYNNHFFHRNFAEEVLNCKNMKNKNFNKKIFSTSCNQGNLGNSTLLTSFPFNKKDSHVKNEQDYLFLLLSAAEGLVHKGLTSFEELLSDSPTLGDENMFQFCGNSICRFSGPKKSKIWVRVKNKNNVMNLCTTCAEAWNNKQFCYYCNVIYADNATTSCYYDTKNWVMCDYCEMWQHIQCEEIQGFYLNFGQLLEEKEFKYMCPLCRRKEDLVNNNSNFSILENPSLFINNEKCKTKRAYKQKNHKSFKNNNSTVNLLKRKLKNENLDYDKTLQGRKKRHVNLGLLPTQKSFKGFSLFNSVDSREIYHDFYKISNLNENKKT